MTTEKKVLTVIVSYNFMPWIHKCIGSVKQSHVSLDIVVIDNRSTDETVETLKRRYPEVELIANEQNLGFGAANNIGIRLAVERGYDAVLLLNQDAWIFPDTISHLSQTAERSQDAGIISPVHLQADEQHLEKGFSHYVKRDSKDALPHEDFEVPFVNAAIWYVPVNTFKRIGMFAPIFYHYGEDTDFVNRLHYHGLKVYVAPQALACHAREDRKLSDDKFIRLEYVYHLTRLTDINQSNTFISLIFNSLQIIHKAVKLTFKGKFALAAAMAALIGELTGQLNAAVKHHHRFSQEKNYF